MVPCATRQDGARRYVHLLHSVLADRADCDGSRCRDMAVRRLGVLLTWFWVSRASNVDAVTARSEVRAAVNWRGEGAAGGGRAEAVSVMGGEYDDENETYVAYLKTPYVGMRGVGVLQFPF